MLAHVYTQPNPDIYGGLMTKRLVDIDDAALRAAQEASGLATIKETVAAGLRELAAIAARRREIEDPETRKQIWR
jgi:Arc/MetJ family transcription regulator